MFREFTDVKGRKATRLDDGKDQKVSDLVEAPYIEGIYEVICSCLVQDNQAFLQQKST